MNSVKLSRELDVAAKQFPLNRTAESSFDVVFFSAVVALVAVILPVVVLVS